MGNECKNFKIEELGPCHSIKEDTEMRSANWSFLLSLLDHMNSWHEVKLGIRLHFVVKDALLRFSNSPRCR